MNGRKLRSAFGGENVGVLDVQGERFEGNDDVGGGEMLRHRTDGTVFVGMVVFEGVQRGRDGRKEKKGEEESAQASGIHDRHYR